MSESDPGADGDETGESYPTESDDGGPRGVTPEEDPPDPLGFGEDGQADTPPAEMGDDDPGYRAESDVSLDDFKASPDPVEKWLEIGGRDVRFEILEASDADAPDLENARSEAEVYRELATFFREQIVAPEAIGGEHAGPPDYEHIEGGITAQDLRDLRMGVAEKMMRAIVPDAGGNLGGL